MKTVKINFIGFWSDFNPTNNSIYNALIKRYKVEMSNIPDFLFYSHNGGAEKFKNCVKVFITGENMIPNFNECDYGQAFAYLNFENRYFRKPHVAERKILDRSGISYELTKRKFCNFIYSNSTWPSTKIRNEFCKQLQAYKRIDCAGKALHNVDIPDLSPRNGNWYKTKLEVLKQYKFTIAFENSSSPGYTTEKIVQPFYSLSIPIYWGNPLIEKEFDSNAFINCHRYKSFEEAIELVKYLDNNDEAYLKMLSKTPTVANYDFDLNEKFEEWIYSIIERGNHPFDKGYCYNKNFIMSLKKP